MPSKARTTTLAFIADAHCGHKLGLLNPETVLLGAEGPWTPGPTEMQRYLWGRMESCRAEVAEWTRGRQRVVLVHNGDLGQGNAFPHSLVSMEPKDQVGIAAAMLRTWLEMPNVAVLRIMVGTDAHTMGAGSIEVLVAEMLSAEFPRKDVRVRWHLKLEVERVPLDLAHHGPVAGGRNWLRGNVARAYLRDRMQRDFNRRKVVPRMYVRAHVHDYLYIEDEIEGVPGGCRGGLLLVPPFSGLTDYGRKSTQSTPELVTGMVMVDVSDGDVARVHANVERLDLRVSEEL